MQTLAKAAFFGTLMAAPLLAPGPRASAAETPASARAPATLRKLALLGAGSEVELEITTSESIVPETQIVTGPDRLVLDFRNCQPAPQLRNLPVDRGKVRGVRVGLFASHPAVTRVVIDLLEASPYQVFSSSKAVIVKFQAAPALATNAHAPPPVQAARASSPPPVQPARASSPPPVVSNDDMPATLPPRPALPLEVRFEGGMLSIYATKATLAEVLALVHARTGADIAIPPEAQQEHVIANLGPGPAKDVLASLLNGSHFNFIVVGSDVGGGRLSSVVLIPRDGGGESMPAALNSTPEEASGGSAPDDATPPEPGPTEPGTAEPPATREGPPSDAPADAQPAPPPGP